MSCEVIRYKNHKLLRCEAKVYTLRKGDGKSFYTVLTLVSGFEAYSTALRGALTCRW